MKTAISLTLLAVAAALLPGSMLELQRGGAAWRIVTCHFTHFTYEQLAWDALVFLSLGIACARRNRIAFRATLLASVLVVPFAVLMFSNVTTYRGLSGLDSALFALLLMMESRRSWIVALCAIGFAMKLIFEMTTGTTLFVGSDAFVAVPVAHLAGAVVGVVVSRFLSPVEAGSQDWLVHLAATACVAGIRRVCTAGIGVVTADHGTGAVRIRGHARR
jgi:membrane associated rhomboid family serine protease